MPVDKDSADQVSQEQQEARESIRKAKEAQRQRIEAAKEKIRARAKTYVIKAGDTLAKIAKEFYGDEGRWKEIAEANKDAIPDPNQIKVGQKITIP
jgi:nucleoid-associated protein YgaU